MAEQELEHLLSPYGTVISTRILRDGNHQPRGVGFARMDAKDKCDLIIQTFNGKALVGCKEPLLVKFADGGNKKKSQSRGSWRDNNGLVTGLPAGMGLGGMGGMPGMGGNGGAGGGMGGGGMGGGGGPNGGGTGDLHSHHHHHHSNLHHAGLMHYGQSMGHNGHMAAQMMGPGVSMLSAAAAAAAAQYGHQSRQFQQAAQMQAAAAAAQQHPYNSSAAAVAAAAAAAAAAQYNAAGGRGPYGPNGGAGPNGGVSSQMQQNHHHSYASPAGGANGYGHTTTGRPYTTASPHSGVPVSAYGGQGQGGGGSGQGSGGPSQQQSQQSSAHVAMQGSHHPWMQMSPAGATGAPQYLVQSPAGHMTGPQMMPSQATMALHLSALMPQLQAQMSGMSLSGPPVRLIFGCL